ncbi:hypothetical protein [Kitasatospora sp. NPDC088548]|uniref:hypothetical protein n=1 Tax=Kitasatospora sp. NPDC088548 TaxID=3364075 RepID=UPI0037FAC591
MDAPPGPAAPARRPASGVRRPASGVRPEATENVLRAFALIERGLGDHCAATP